MAKYTPARVIEKSRLNSNDLKLVMTVVLSEGKKGFNTKASIKRVGDKSVKAMTGGRATFTSEKDAKMAFDKLVSEAKTRGWIAGAMASSLGSRNAFTVVPTPAEVKFDANPKAVKVGKKTTKRAVAA